MTAQSSFGPARSPPACQTSAMACALPRTSTRQSRFTVCASGGKPCAVASSTSAVAPTSRMAPRLVWKMPLVAVAQRKKAMPRSIPPPPSGGTALSSEALGKAGSPVQRSGRRRRATGLACSHDTAVRSVRASPGEARFGLARATTGGRDANRRRTASPARDVHTKNSGMNSTAMNVAASMPPMTPVPIECRLAAPAPVESASGSTPKMNASDVMTIGRKRSRAASTAASLSPMPPSRCRCAANSTIRMAFFAAKPTSVTRPTCK